MSPPPSLGEFRFAFSVLSTEMRVRKRRSALVWRRFVESAALLTFLFFLLM